MNLFVQMFLQFFHVGLFSFGGGYATLPFLFHIADKFHWYTTEQLKNMLAVASITPGPVGINVATYTGFTTSGLFGAFIATGAIILPSFLIVIFVAKILNTFKTNKYVQGVIKALKASGCALLSSVGIKLILTSNLHLLGSLFLFILLLISFRQKRDPLFYFVISGLFGLFLGFFNLIGV